MVIRSQTGTCSRAKHLRLRTTVVIGPRDEPPYRLRSREVDLLVADWRGVAWLRGRTLSQPARAFVELLLEHDAELHELEKTILRAG
jgi:hypothetical protein